MSLSFSAEALLKAIDGVAYVVDGEGVILGFSHGPFMRGGNDPRAPYWDAATAIGANLFAMIGGDEVRASFRMLHRTVWSGGGTPIGFEYRCDTPETERRMRMSLSLVQSGGTPAAILYQSVMLSETPRVPLPLFAADFLTAARPFVAGDRIIILCSYCQRVAWPMGAATESCEWIEAVEFYRRDEGGDVAVSHGVCGDCFSRVIESATV